MKLSNFLRFDPNYEGKGLKGGSQLEEEIWNEFSNDPIKLKNVAGAILKNYESLGNRACPPEDETDGDEEASEGRVLTRIHKARERNTKIVRKKKESVLQKSGALNCEACDFNFHEVYGQLGEGFAECHHEKPVSELIPGEKTRLSDLRIVCSSCHRMIHRSKPWLSVDELAKILKNQTAGSTK